MKSMIDSEPNTTIHFLPMIDVLLVLLMVLFIIQKPSVKTLNIQLASVTGGKFTETKHMLFVNEYGEIFWQQRAISYLELDQEMATRQKDLRSSGIQLSADARTHYATIVQLISYLQSHQIENVQLVIQEPRF
ncbi:MAG: biopolymer transporter ExbD, partial [Gammaproteobacteria bacterium]|nr:biopolymer transporter ExbD [Gammaproteobacteria bacterium]